MVEHKINGPHHHGEVVLEQNIVLGPEQNVMEMLVPEFDNNYNYLQPVNGQAMLPVELEMLYGPNPNQELQFGSGYNFYNPFAVFVNNQEQDLIHIEVNSPHNNEFEPHGLHGNEEKDLSPQFQSDSNILSPFINDLAFDSSRFNKRQSFTFLPKQKQTDFYKFSVLQKNIWL
ncbi:hypothetical protein Bca52824_052923 [Brassica carinata]|uniref:Uncharacterized protein n=1 Tax=Brassica carinata TaxID=52824 RepID=A0A8X7R835_BRACI|nr:hypothetical protein Bca52824_052923 [Brassica carinata]